MNEIQDEVENSGVVIFIFTIAIYFINYKQSTSLSLNSLIFYQAKAQIHGQVS